MKADAANDITFLGEFKDKNLEKEFFIQDMENARRYLGRIALILGFLYLLFIIPDYLLVDDPMAFRAILINRSVFMTLVVFFYLIIKKIKAYETIAILVMAYEITAAGFYISIFHIHQDQDFLIQAFGITLIILAIYLMPNKWIYMQVSAAVIIAIFILFSVLFVRDVNTNEFLAGIVYILVASALVSCNSFRINYHKRKQYIYGKELLKISITDPLTGIYNRVKMDEELKRWIEYSKRYNTPFSLLFFDFDDFKRINDKYGHLAGDRVILDTVAIVQSSIRVSDVFCRWGGEEFIIILPNTDTEKAMELAERLRNTIEKNSYDIMEKITCSFGLASYRENDNADSLMYRVDQLLYEAKKQGKNKVVC